MSKPWIAAGCLLALGIWALALGPGCGGGGSANTVPVTGTVTYNNQPVEGAVVSFIPVREGQSAIGKTNASGRYTMRTAQSDGVVPGQYRVKIEKFEGGERATGPSGPTVEEYPADYAETEAQAGAAPTPAPKHLLPAKYADPTTSGFTVTVSSGQQNTFDFALTD